jgi:hypothetical protein
MTPTSTPTISITPTITPTVSITRTITPTISLTKTPTNTPTLTPATYTLRLTAISPDGDFGNPNTECTSTGLPIRVLIGPRIQTLGKDYVPEIYYNPNNCSFSAPYIMEIYDQNTPDPESPNGFLLVLTALVPAPWDGIKFGLTFYPRAWGGSYTTTPLYQQYFSNNARFVFPRDSLP